MSMSLVTTNVEEGDDMETINYRNYINEVEDFPKPGVRFYDIAPLLGNGAVFATAVHDMAVPLANEVNKVVGFDARGFVFGAAVAHELGVGFAMLRKPGKLPGAVGHVEYGLEYGENALELQVDVVSESDRVVLIDDVIATGGTAQAGIELVRARGAEIVAFSTLIDLPHLGGSKLIESLDVPVRSLVTIDQEA